MEILKIKSHYQSRLVLICFSSWGKRVWFDSLVWAKELVLISSPTSPSEPVCVQDASLCEHLPLSRALGLSTLQVTGWLTGEPVSFMSGKWISPLNCKPRDEFLIILSVENHIFILIRVTPTGISDMFGLRRIERDDIYCPRKITNYWLRIFWDVDTSTNDSAATQFWDSWETMAYKYRIYFTGEKRQLEVLNLKYLKVFIYVFKKYGLWFF